MSMNDERPDDTPTLPRRTVVQAAAWAAPAIAVTAAAPMIAASGLEDPTDINVLKQPTPPREGQAFRLTFRGEKDFEIVPFPANSTATVTVTGGTFPEGPTWSGATVLTDSGTDPRVIQLQLTADSFYLQGQAPAGTVISTVVKDAANRTIGSDTTTIASAG